MVWTCPIQANNGTDKEKFLYRLMVLKEKGKANDNMDESNKDRCKEV